MHTGAYCLCALYLRHRLFMCSLHTRRGETGRRTDISRERGLKENEKDTLCYQGYAEKGDKDGDATLSQ